MKKVITERIPTVPKFELFRDEYWPLWMLTNGSIPKEFTLTNPENGDEVTKIVNDAKGSAAAFMDILELELNKEKNNLEHFLTQEQVKEVLNIYLYSYLKDDLKKHTVIKLLLGCTKGAKIVFVL